MQNTMIKVMETGLMILLVLPCSALTCEKCYNSACDKEGICLNGCVVGFFGKKCSYPCQEGCVDNHCHLDNRGRSVCTIGCVPGYYGEQCRAPCHSTNIDNKCDRYTGVPPVCNGSRHGPHCLLDCQCHGQICGNNGICHDLCTNGYFGKDCRERCSSRCRICTDTDVNCEDCHEGFYGDSCQYTCNSDVSREDIARYKSVSGCRTTESRRHASETSNEVQNLHLIIVSVLVIINTVIMGTLVFKAWKKRRKLCCCGGHSREKTPEEKPLKSMNKI